MKYLIKYAFAFVAGATVGSVVTRKLLKTRYEQIAQEEIDSVKEVFARRGAESNNERARIIANEAKEKPNIVDYAARLRKMEYANHSDVTHKEENEECESTDRPHVISPYDFGEIEDYDRVSLTYYSDRVLTDENNELVEDVDNTVGTDSLDHFGEFEDENAGDAVYVRNDRLKTDFEILLDQRKYSEVINKKPHQVED